MKVKSDRRSKLSNFKQLEGRSLKNIRASMGFETRDIRRRHGHAKVTGSNSVEALIFFRLLPSNCLKLENLLRWSLFAIINIIIITSKILLIAVAVELLQ